MSEKDVIRTLTGVAFDSCNTRLRIDAIRSLAAYLSHPDASCALHHLVAESTVPEVRAEALKALGRRGAVPHEASAGRDLRG